jgi:hypothetical protein
MKLVYLINIMDGLSGLSLLLWFVLAIKLYLDFKAYFAYDF